ncbi:sulfate adenylyltransferase, large subunit [Clostridium sp. DL-VIII]|uniref:sulfate adenylyltransferase subunit 1 n=1 Tax=Clostridium sp. DL-VIII TaxID=641107 RepID=UPI00023AF3B6|nr:GTP-binding protein [Clostridium sp. DL-VIII]EHI97183.1 sulfate adenylyltransferase, large subunit [Clostridium sp. DL-VIII]
MKSLLKFITCGSVDDGKSTLIGHILYDAKLLYADQEKALELDSKVGSRGGAIDYSLLLDGLMAEREQGITIDVAYRYFTTDNRSFIVADTPGHEEYTRNMAVGASFAELAIILVDAKQGVLVQTRRHARICSLMGIKHLVFAVNKMDLVGYSHERFLEIEEQIKELKEELSLENIYIIPVSATEGDNVTKKSENIPWYTGEALLPYLENVDVESEVEEGFYMPVQRVCRPNHTFRGFQGEIESGTIAVGDEIITLPSNEKAVVKSIHITDKESQSATKGQAVTIQLNKEVDVSRGCVLTKETKLAANKSFSATILWMDDSELTAGKEYFVKVGTKMLTGIVTDLKYKIDVNTGEHLPVGLLKKNEIAACDITLSEKVVVDKFNDHKELGELILIDRITNMTSACGVIEEINNNDIKNVKFSFEYKDLKARGDVFEEFYYDTETLSIFKYKREEQTYTIGDELPVKGESYEYPEDFDLLVLRDWVAIEVRGKIITNIKSIDDYDYRGVPIINGRGFEVKINSNEETINFLNEYKEIDAKSEGDFLNKWVKFETYRKVIFNSIY